jgi:hypothetical protein
MTFRTVGVGWVMDPLGNPLELVHELKR